jgi:hypothetical protein
MDLFSPSTPGLMTPIRQAIPETNVYLENVEHFPDKPTMTVSSWFWKSVSYIDLTLNQSFGQLKRNL